jgi:outer membrane biogenesis lipoprotein LolB
MKIALDPRLVIGLCLLLSAGTRAAMAAEITEDAQEQARTMLSGRSFQVNGSKSGVATPRPEGSTSVALDAQEQGREMILGRPAASTPGVRREADRARADDATGDRKVEEDALEMARRMILGSQARGARGESGSG